MPGLDQAIGGLGSGQAFLVVMAVALLLGLRHATDPDHLAAVSTLIATDEDAGSRRAAALGLAWGTGHATSLIGLGLPIVVAGAFVPERVRQAAELAVGLVIVALALRLLVRWRRGRFHAHLHHHGPMQHRHLHPHGHAAGHDHRHEAEALLGRTRIGAYGIGLAHGVGGSAGVAVLLLAALPSRAEAAAALGVFALGTAASMAMLSWALGFALTRGPVLRRVLGLAPALGVASLAFGLWYSSVALRAITSPF
jgi:ABC-type nickel/cobalt efflux system permease component RcnA